MQLAKLPTKRQKEVLLRVLKYIKQEPDRLDMTAWGRFHPTAGYNEETGKIDVALTPTTFEPYDYKKQPIPPCKTTGCLAGTILLVTKKGQKEVKSVLIGEPKNREYSVEFPDDTNIIASDILKLTEKQAGDLFYFKSWGNSIEIPTGTESWGQPDTKTIILGWPKEFERAYNKAKTGKERYKVLEARVKYFFKKGL